MQPPTTAPFRLRPAQAPDLPAGELGLLLHGRYVDPTHQRCGIGSQLLDAAEAAAGRRVLMAFWSRRRRMPMVFSKRGACGGCRSETQRGTIRTASGWRYIIDITDLPVRLFSFQK
jgi:GNAT superfamily N-acetyltransferase